MNWYIVNVKGMPFLVWAYYKWHAKTIVIRDYYSEVLDVLKPEDITCWELV